MVTETTGQAAGPSGKGKAVPGTHLHEVAPWPKRETPQVPDAVTFNPGDVATLHVRGPRFAEHNGHIVEVCKFDPHKGTYIVKLPCGATLGVQPKCLTLYCKGEDIQEDSPSTSSEDPHDP